MRSVMGLLIVVALSACQHGDREHRQAANNLFDPVCAPDGSVVRIEYANSKGNFTGIETSHENCPWYKK